MKTFEITMPEPSAILRANTIGELRALYKLVSGLDSDWNDMEGFGENFFEALKKRVHADALKQKLARAEIEFGAWAC